ncbi:uncharacterized protein MELLADRAFT_108549 [Melampsora larici-populina 98AG31]|uniref:Secreted protein n=1 Tax=Melampsora larici-populina (strain 98AG31 / pathotype 3-4-7) TaxID=747676 RepID=F4RTG3_MELLP|nr:uncharacterized protein MELLADRAFT_108549 [Melampsora larici-populina 98AG31]EGG04343.1 secreted protein [Melampsora larici-populina 98AG31]
MRSLILLGSLLHVLFVMGHPEPIGNLQGRDLTGLELIHSNMLSKRTTAPRNPAACRGVSGKVHEFDVQDYRKVITHLVSNQVSCAYFKNIAMLVIVEATVTEAVFQHTSAKYVKNWFVSDLSATCCITNPVKLVSKPPPPSDDDGLNIQVVFFDESMPSAQVEDCDDELKGMMLSIARQQ